MLDFKNSLIALIDEHESEYTKSNLSKVVRLLAESSDSDDDVNFDSFVLKLRKNIDNEGSIFLELLGMPYDRAKMYQIKPEP